MSEDGHSLSARVFHTLREEILSGKYQKDEELKEKDDRRGTRSQPDTGAGSLKAVRIRRFSHDNSKPGSFCGGNIQR